MNADDLLNAGLPMASSTPTKRQLILEFYETLKANQDIQKLINWDGFAKEADSAGLHYHKTLGLMTKDAWNAISPFLKETQDV